MRQAILLVNLGSPDSPSKSDVRRYLDQFLMDPEVLDMPVLARNVLVRGYILNTRPAKSAEAYSQIWTSEGSPLIVISRRTRAALENLMQVPVGLAMRYGEPSVASGVAELLARAGNVDELVVVALYPHYAMASTKTAEDAVEAVLRGKNVNYRFVPPFYDDPGYLDALAARMKAEIPADTQYVLFSYHGVPQRHVRKTDPTGTHCLRSPDCCANPSPAWTTCYRHQVIATTEGAAARLDLGNYGFSFQSRLGSGWLEPYTDKELEALPLRGIKRLAVVCPSFVADCLETLEEMEMRGRETFLEAGGEHFTYVRCLNDDPAWIAALATLCRKTAPLPA